MSNLRFIEHECGVGVTVLHAQIAAGLAPHHTLQIWDLLNRYKLVVFPAQNLTDEQLLRFAYRFGPPFVSGVDHPVLGSVGGSNHEVVVIGNAAAEYPDAYLGHQEVLPHSDHQWLRCPSSTSLLYAVDIENGSAPTEWMDMARAYSMLRADTRELIEHLRMITYNPFYRPFGSVCAKVVNREEEVPPGAVFPHPLVRTHPLTREKILYLNAAYEVELVGVPYQVAAPLIGQLHEHIQALKCRYVRHWQNGDVVLWDNQSTLHYRSAFAHTTRRVLKRVSIGGGAPY